MGAETFETLYSQKDAIVEVATELIGSVSIRYVAGHPELGQSLETGFDCSGFVRFVLLQTGLHVPDYIGMDTVQRPVRHTNEFWDHYGVTVGTEPEPGDLIFFTRTGLFPTHMGIVRDSESYIHAPGRDATKVVRASITAKMVDTTNVQGRILYPANPIGYKAPTQAHATPTYRQHQQLLEAAPVHRGDPALHSGDVRRSGDRHGAYAGRGREA
ncbi:MAG: C40 family peptidase [Candidatus Saccharibacteria bacterium]